MAYKRTYTQFKGTRFNKPRKARKMYRKARAGYSTVPRTRGVYAAGETKYFDSARTSSFLVATNDWTGTEFPPNNAANNTLCVPTVGSGINQRIGRSVQVYKISIKGQITSAPQGGETTADTPAVIRLALVQDTQTNATQAQGEEIFQATGISTTLNVHAFQSLASLGRFKVLKDKTISLQNPNMGNTGAGVHLQNGIVRTFKITHRFTKPVSVSFNAVNGGSIADIVDNSWSVYAEASNIGLVPALVYNARCYYKDK